MPDLPGGSSAAPTRVPDHVGDDRSAMVGDDDDLEAVGEGEGGGVGREFRLCRRARPRVRSPPAAAQKAAAARFMGKWVNRCLHATEFAAVPYVVGPYSGRMWPSQSPRRPPAKKTTGVSADPPRVDQVEAGNRGDSRGAASSRTTSAPRRQPAAGQCRGKRLFAEALAIGRIGEDQRERRDRCRPAPARVASRRKMRVRPVSPSASILARMAPRAATASSTKSAKAAPRDSASRPSAPVPAKRSSTRAP